MPGGLYPRLSEVKFSAFQHEIIKGVIKPAYLFTGEEEFLADTGIQMLVDKLLTPEEKQLNLVRINGADADGLCDTLRTPPLFSKYRITIVKKADKLKDQPLDSVISFAKSPPKDGVLVLHAETIDKRYSFYKQLSNLVEIIECNKPRENEKISWIKGYISKQGKDIDDDAIARLIAVNWPGMRDLTSELDRLVLMVGDAQVITSKDIDEMGGGSFVIEIWKLTDAIGNADNGSSVLTAENLRSWNVRPTQVIASLFRFFQKLWVIKWAIAQGKIDQVRTRIGLIPFLFNRYTGFARKATMKGIEEGLLRILEADLNIKRGVHKGEMEIFLLVNQLSQTIRSGNQAKPG